jgi:hypothetical protein
VSFEKYSRSRRGRGCGAGTAGRLCSPRSAPAVWPRPWRSRAPSSGESGAAPRPKLVVPAPARRPRPAGAPSGRGRAGLRSAAAARLRAAGALRSLGNLGFAVLLFRPSELFIPRSPAFLPPSLSSPLPLSLLLASPRSVSRSPTLCRSLSCLIPLQLKKGSQLKAVQLVRPSLCPIS